MDPSNHIIEVNEADFQTEVLAYSNQMPVIVDFWAEWCIPCRTLDPMLEKLTDEADGAFRLAKLNVDDNPRLAQHYVVSTIPSVKVFRAGQVIDEFTGAKTEPELREFLRGLAPSSADLAIEKGESLLAAGRWQAGSKAFRQALKVTPDRGEALLGLARSLLAQGKAPDALVVLREFPASKQYNQSQNLLPLAVVLAAEPETESPDEEDELGPAYAHVLRLTRLGNLPAALDGLLDILSQDKKYRGGEAREVGRGLLVVLGEKNSETHKYRTELANLLF